jgi:hypothetical protein
MFQVAAAFGSAGSDAPLRSSFAGLSDRRQQKRSPRYGVRLTRVRSVNQCKAPADAFLEEFGGLENESIPSNSAYNNSRDAFLYLQNYP